jgi:hypothetical protein
LYSGEGQHALTRRLPDPLPPRDLYKAQGTVVESLGIVALLAIVGKSRPGTFLKATAYLSTAHICAATWHGYSSREINRAVFKLDNIDAKPGRLWERTKHWTVDDMCIGGAVLGAFLALQPRAFPGVKGWRRFLGAATVGSAFGAHYGTEIFLNLSPDVVHAAFTTNTHIRTLQYQRLKQDMKAQETLSRFGRLAFAVNASPIWSMSINPFKNGSQSGPSGMAGNTEGDILPGPIEDTTKRTVFQIQFDKGELEGPDLDLGGRTYTDSLSDRNVNTLQEWLDHLEGIQKITSSEALWVWNHLANKEHQFYNLQEDNDEKDKIRLELRALNHVTSILAMRESILIHFIADARKRLEQMDQKNPVSCARMEKAQLTVEERSADWFNHHSPQLAIELVRFEWTTSKQVMGIGAQYLEMAEAHKPESGTPQEASLRNLRKTFNDMKNFHEATGRVLKELEEQQHKADEHRRL